MPKLELEQIELDLAVELLERDAADLREEILHTDDRHYRDELKEEEKLLLELLRKFKEAM